MAQDNLYDELTDEIATAGVLGDNKVANFAYTDTAYADINQAAGTDEYDPDLENNIPTPSSEVLNTNPTILAKGMRSQASSLTRQLVNHFFGRTSYNLNKIVDTVKAALTSVKNALGRSNGIATLDASGRIPYSQLPESAIEYKGGWNASTNQPHLENGTGTKGDMYIVTTAGYADLGGGTEYYYAGDRVIYSGTVWQRLPAGDVKTVCNVAPDGNGNVALTKSDVGLGNVWNYDYRSAFNGIAYNSDNTALSFSRVSDATAASVPAMTGASSSAAGKAGLVPKPAAGNQGLFLRGDGSWATPSGTYSLPTATSSVLGGVKIGSNISISSGTISVANASTSAKGVIQLGGGTTNFLRADGTWATPPGTYSLPTATSSVLGGVKIGSNISVSSGTISVADASTSAKGVVQVGTGLAASSGTLRVTNAALAAAFSTSTTYAVGKIVTYAGNLYKCTTAHTAGAWNSSHFTSVTAFGGSAVANAQNSGMVPALKSSSQTSYFLSGDNTWQLLSGATVGKATSADTAEHLTNVITPPHNPPTYPFQVWSLKDVNITSYETSYVRLEQVVLFQVYGMCFIMLKMSCTSSISSSSSSQTYHFRLDSSFAITASGALGSWAGFQNQFGGTGVNFSAANPSGWTGGYIALTLQSHSSTIPYNTSAWLSYTFINSAAY